jgi:hypothetical protein
LLKEYRKESRHPTRIEASRQEGAAAELFRREKADRESCAVFPNTTGLAGETALKKVVNI